MSDNNLPEPPTTDQTGFPLMSEAEDPEEFRDQWGAVIDEYVSRHLEDILTGDKQVPGLDVDELVSKTHSTEKGHIEKGNIRNRSIGPFDNASFSTITVRSANVGLTSVIFPHSDGVTWTIVFRQGMSHGFDADSVIKAIDTNDRGQTFSNERVIYNDDTDARNFGGRVMDNGRFGIFLPRSDGGYTDPVFLFSDDEGSSWSTNVITSLSTPTQGYEMRRYPASVGGDDSQGFFVPTNADGSNEAFIVKTTDNGETWSETLIDNPSDNLLEHSVERIGNDDKWIAVARNNESGSLPGEIYTSTDLTNWTGPASMNADLGKNRPMLIEDNGQLTLLTANRTTEGDGIDGLAEGVYLQRVNASETFDDPGSTWGDWELIGHVDERAIGYPDVISVDGDYYATLMTGEDRSNMRSALRLISDHNSSTNTIATSTRETSNYVSGVGGDPVDIYNNPGSSHLTIFGQGSEDAGKKFVDIVLKVRENITVVSSESRFAPERTYETGSSFSQDLALSLDNPEEDYNISVKTSEHY